MKFLLTSKKFSISDDTKSFMQQKLSKLEKYSSKLTNAHVIVKKEKFNFPVEIVVSGKLINIKGEGVTSDMNASFEVALNKILSQMQRIKDRLRRPRGTDRYRGEIEIFREPVRTDPIDVIDEKEITIEKMSVEAAIPRLKAGSYSFFLFADAASGRLSVLYKRSDGTFGRMKIIEK